MKRIVFLLLMAVVAVGSGFAQGAAQDQQKMMEAFMKAGAVTADHAALEYFVGRWEMTQTSWAMPGAPPSTAKGTEEGVLILGGRFVRMNFTGTMMGQPYEGIQITGYDNIQKRYISLWIDNSGTGFTTMAGPFDQASKTYHQYGSMTDPISGPTPFHIAIKIVGPDEYAFELYMRLPDGKEFKSMEYRSVRKK